MSGGNESLAERLSYLLRTFPGGHRAFAAALNVDPTAVIHWKSGRRRPDSARLSAMADLLHTSVDFLLGRTDDPAATGAIAVAEDRAPYGSDGFAAIPRLATAAAAGNPVIPSERIAATYPFREEWLLRVVGPGATAPGRLVLIGVEHGWLGESMVPTIRPGAVLLVDRRPPELDANTIHQGRIYMVRIDDGLTVKRLFSDGNNLICVPDNPGPDAGPRTIRLTSGTRLSHVVVGRVRWVGQELED